jgi:phospho-N-acetylmuramoyl-pentapeptide-transferase
VILWLLRALGWLTPQQIQALRVSEGTGPHLILRMAGAAALSFLIVMILAPRIIRFLVRRKIRDMPQFDNRDLDQITRHKSRTPTMGGILIVGAILTAVLVFGNLSNGYIRISLVPMIWLGALGAWDDWLKLRRVAGKGSRDGLKSWEKILFQIGLAVLLAIFTYNYDTQSGYRAGEEDANQAGAEAPSHAPIAYRVGEEPATPAHYFYLPFTPHAFPLSQLAYVIIAVLTIVGASNAVNLTDGMDGLASGCVMITTFVLLILAELVNVIEYVNLFKLPLVVGAGEMTIICSAMLGSCLGFLWYNAAPAQVFMGDTGSLTLGGLMGYIAVVTRQEILLVVAGGVFVMEAVSVILQVSYFKLTRPAPGAPGKRLFRIAPIHHHFHMGGWAETKVVTRFWVLGIVFAALALAMLKLR